MDIEMHRRGKSQQQRTSTGSPSLEDLSASGSDRRSLLWFLLLWVGAVSFWECARILLEDPIKLPFGSFAIIMTRSLPSSQGALLPPPSLGPLPPRFEHLSAPLNVIFLLLVVFHFLLHCLYLSGRFPQRWSWLYFLFQAGCVLTLSLMWSDLIITLGFYLVLVIEALNVLKQIRHIVIIVACFLALFLATTIIQILQMTIWMTLESVLLLVVFLVGWILLLIQQTHARSRLEAAHLQLAAFAMRMEELTLVNERQRLARELHDTLAQDLVGLTLQLERIDQHLEKKRFERARELAQQAMSRARTTLAEARTAIDDLRANALGPQDLLQALHREIDRFRETTSIACVADIAALAQTPSALCEHVLRAITEGLTNAARHSQAQQVHICAQFQEDFLTIEIGDDGRGFESAALATLQGHYGLLGVRERARLCGGHLMIESAPGQGTVLRLHLPTQTRGGVL